MGTRARDQGTAISADDKSNGLSIKCSQNTEKQRLVA